MGRPGASRHLPNAEDAPPAARVSAAVALLQTAAGADRLKSSAASGGDIKVIIRQIIDQRLRGRAVLIEQA